jgi:hypothetical protein
MGYKVIQYRSEHRDAFTDNGMHSSGPLILQSLSEYLNVRTQNNVDICAVPIM